MITMSCPTQNIEIGDIVVNKYNRFSHGYHLKYRVSGFFHHRNISLVEGFRVKWDRRTKQWVSFGQVVTLMDCYKLTDEEKSLGGIL